MSIDGAPDNLRNTAHKTPKLMKIRLLATITALLATVFFAGSSHARAALSTRPYRLHYGDFSADVISFHKSTTPQAAPAINDTSGGFELTWLYVDPQDEVVEVAEVIYLPFDVDSVQHLGNGVLAVSGRDIASAESVVQILTIKKPQVVLEFPSGDASIVPRGLARVGQERRSPKHEKGYPIWSTGFPGSTSFLVFFSTHQVWEYSSTGGAPSLVVNDHPVGNEIHLDIPRMSVPKYALNHVDHGKIIIVRTHDGSNIDYLFIDDDRDGRLDSVLEITREMYKTLELYNPAKLLPS